MEHPSPKRRRAVVFDLDGTLIDSAPDLAAALDRLLVEEGRPALGLEAVKMLIGDGAQRLVERAFYGDDTPPD
ncbi:MAG: HAD hydrolase-like protein, partial [Rhodospirillaceae bacterium]|nr:HAD hydrolase-like protein [Rhodospirillaceae bacterium]